MTIPLKHLGFVAVTLALFSLPLAATAENPLGPLAPEPVFEPAPEDDASAGRFSAMGGIFGEQRIDCIRCHGLDGMGNSSGAFPRLAGQNAWYLYKTLTDYAAGRRPSAVMVPIARTMTDQQMRDIAAYYAQVAGPNPFDAPKADVQMLQVGGAIAAVGLPRQGVPACTSCHGANGQGLPPVNPALSGQFASYLEHQLLLWKKGLRGGDPMDVMARIASAMTEDQIRAVALYYASVTGTDWLTESEADVLAPETDSEPVPTAPTATQDPAPGAGFAPNVLPPYLPSYHDQIPEGPAAFGSPAVSP